MVRLACSFSILALAASSAFASPVTIGAGVGATQSRPNANQDPDATLSIFGRLGVSDRLSLELDLTKVGDDSTGTSARTATGFVVFDLGSSKTWVPQIFAGAGVDREQATYGGETDGHHFEGGAGLEYRTTGGFVVGARIHVGGRTIDSQPLVEPYACCDAYYQNSKLPADEFRALDAYAGIRF